MRGCYFSFIIILLISIIDFVMWDFSTYFSISFYFKIIVFAAWVFYSSRGVSSDEGSINHFYVSEMTLLLFFSLWFALLHHAHVDYLSKASGFGFFAAAFAMFSLIVSFVEKLMFGGVWQKLALSSMKIFMYSLLALGGYLLVFGEWRWELISLLELL